jgi:hypothetical protein
MRGARFHPGQHCREFGLVDLVAAPLMDTATHDHRNRVGHHCPASGSRTIMAIASAITLRLERKTAEHRQCHEADQGHHATDTSEEHQLEETHRGWRLTLHAVQSPRRSVSRRHCGQR